MNRQIVSKWKEKKGEILTYSKRMKSFGKINTFYFILNRNKKKGEGRMLLKMKTWQHYAKKYTF